jgi:hypothetical protein
MAEDVIVLLDFIGWTGKCDLHVVGVSLGGMIAQGTSPSNRFRLKLMILDNDRVSDPHTRPNCVFNIDNNDCRRIFSSMVQPTTCQLYVILFPIGSVCFNKCRTI